MLPGRTIITRAAPETTDDEGPLVVIPGTSKGSDEPFLARFATSVDGEVVGRTRITEAKAETTDDPSESHPEAVAAPGTASRGRTITTKVAAETTDDDPRF